MSSDDYNSRIWDGGRLTKIGIGYMKGRLESAARELEDLDERTEELKRVPAEVMRLEFTI